MRARSLKPSTFKNEVLGAADPLYTILFQGLWCEADREGRLEDRPMRIKGEIFPYRDGIDTDAMLTWLDTNGFIKRYKAKGIAVIQVLKFSEHQRPHKNEVESVLPSMEEAEKPKAVKTSRQGSKSAQPRHEALRSDSGLLTPHSLTPDSGLMDCEPTSASPPQQPERKVFEHWQKTWGHEGTTLDSKRLGKIRARLKVFTPEQICDAISGFKHSDWHTGLDPKGGGVIYDSIGTLLRDDEQVEKGLQYFRHPPRPPPKPVELSPIERVRLANGVVKNDERVVSEQRANGSEGMDDPFGDVWRSPNTGLRRIGS